MLPKKRSVAFFKQNGSHAWYIQNLLGSIAKTLGLLVAISEITATFGIFVPLPPCQNGYWRAFMIPLILTLSLFLLELLLLNFHRLFQIMDMDWKARHSLLNPKHNASRKGSHYERWDCRQAEDIRFTMNYSLFPGDHRHECSPIRQGILKPAIASQHKRYSELFMCRWLPLEHYQSAQDNHQKPEDWSFDQDRINSFWTGTRPHENILVFKIGHKRDIVLEHNNDQKTMTDLMNFKQSLS